MNMETYYINPLSKPRMVSSDRWKKRPIVQKYWAYKDLIRLHKVEIPVPCRIIFNIPMPRTWSEKKRLEMNDRPHQQKPDIDNLIKGLFDAIHEEDCHIWGVHAEKRWAKVGSIKIGTL